MAMKRGKAAAGGDMFIVDNRVASFKTRKWPHAKAMIPKVAGGRMWTRQFAEAGWYHVPADDAPDFVKCFMCSKGLDGWEKDDDPQVEHKKHAPQCPWMTLEKEESRVATFEHWPHPPSFKATPRTMAQAGWYFSPTLEAPDRTICYLCNLGLGGWEEEDSPMPASVSLDHHSAEHRKRKPTCQVVCDADARDAAASAQVAAAPAPVAQPTAKAARHLPKAASSSDLAVPVPPAAAPKPAAAAEPAALVPATPSAASAARDAEPVAESKGLPRKAPLATGPDAAKSVGPAAKAQPTPAAAKAAPTMKAPRHPTAPAAAPPPPSHASQAAQAAVPAPAEGTAPTASGPVAGPTLAAPQPSAAAKEGDPAPAAAGPADGAKENAPLDYDPAMTVEQFLRSLLEKQVTLLREDTERQVQQFADAAKATRAKLAELKTSL